MALDIKENIPLAPLTTFKIGGPARYFVDVATEDEMREAIQWAHEKSLTFIVLAGGSNVLVPDEGYDGLVIHIVSGHFSFAHLELDADGGCNLLGLIQAAGTKGLGGWESLAGIPGTIGGAVRGNAGAFGPEIKDFVHKVKAINIHSGETRTFVNAECGFSYRNSFFKQNPKWLITRVFIGLHKKNSAESAKLAEETIAEREKRHLQNVQAAGSFFMNPTVRQEIIEMFETEQGVKSREGRVPAGWLIEKAGMKGAKVGDAQASLQHPNYIVNTGKATSHDVRNLAQLIKLEVFNQFEVELKEEAVIL